MDIWGSFQELKSKYSLTVALACFMVMFKVAILHAQDIRDKTEIVVIGTVHDSTANYTVTTLVDILRKVDPGVVLLEFDSSFFNESLTALKEKYEASTLETRAATSIYRTSNTELKPYDIEGRNEFYVTHNSFKLDDELFKELTKLYEGNLLVPEARMRLDVLDKFFSIRDSFGTERPEVINSSACDAVEEAKQHYMYEGIKKVIELTPSVQKYETHWHTSSDFWVRRNGTMAQNIIRYSTEYSGKRIVVLCGFEHRYYLRKVLKEKETEQEFVLKEYWSY